MGVELKFTGESSQEVVAHLRDWVEFTMGAMSGPRGEAPAGEPAREPAPAEAAEAPVKRRPGRPARQPVPYEDTKEGSREIAKTMTTEDVTRKALPDEPNPEEVAAIVEQREALYNGFGRNTIEAARSAIKDLLMVYGSTDADARKAQPMAVEILAKFGASRLGDVKAEDYAELIDLCLAKIKEVVRVG